MITDSYEAEVSQRIVVTKLTYIYPHHGHGIKCLSRKISAKKGPESGPYGHTGAHEPSVLDCKAHY